MKIIGYIHICQKTGWERSFDMLWKSIKESGLYDNTDEIRVGIVNDYNGVIDNERLKDDKIKIIGFDNSTKYERLTILHMREMSEKEDAYYYYLHSKGLRWFGTEHEINVIEWIKLMLYCNIELWKDVIQIFDNLKYQTYGCDMTIDYPKGKSCYAGNFWWCKSKYMATLPKTIGPSYIDPEMYLLDIKNVREVAYCCMNSGLQNWGDHYRKYLNEKQYRGKLIFNGTKHIWDRTVRCVGIAPEIDRLNNDFQMMKTEDSENPSND